MSEPTRRFMCLPDGTMYESARGQWVGYDVLKLATQRAEAAEAERDALRKALLRCDRTCETVMHRELERHGLGERCPVVGLIDAALAVQP